MTGIQPNAHVDLGDDIGVVEQILPDGRMIVSSVLTGDKLELAAGDARPAVPGARRDRPDERAIALWSAMTPLDTIEASMVQEFGTDGAEEGMLALRRRAVSEYVDGDPLPGDEVAMATPGGTLHGIAVFPAPGHRLHVAWQINGRQTTGTVPVSYLDLARTYEARAMRSIRAGIEMVALALQGAPPKKPKPTKPVGPTINPPVTKVHPLMRPPEDDTGRKITDYPPLEDLKSISDVAQAGLQELVELDAKIRTAQSEIEDLTAEIKEITDKLPEQKRKVELKTQVGNDSVSFATTAAELHEILEQEMAALGNLNTGSFAQFQAELQLTREAARRGYNQFLVFYRKWTSEERRGSAEKLAGAKELMAILLRRMPEQVAEISAALEEFQRVNMGVREVTRAILSVGPISEEYIGTTKPVLKEPPPMIEDGVARTSQDLRALWDRVSGAIRKAWTAMISAIRSTDTLATKIDSDALAIRSARERLEQAIRSALAEERWRT